MQTKTHMTLTFDLEIQWVHRSFKDTCSLSMQNFINYGKFMHYHIHIEKNSGENNTVVTSMGSNN